MERARGGPVAFGFILEGRARTIRCVPPEVNRLEDVSAPAQEGNLLIEAVSLLVQRQRETETWVSERLWQAEQRAGETDRRYAALESRLANIEAHLARLATDIEPAADDERVARLRDQLAGLRGQTLHATDDTVSTRPIELFQISDPGAAKPSGGAYVIDNRATPAPTVAAPRPAAPAASVPPAVQTSTVTTAAAPPAATVSTTSATRHVGFMETLGATPGDRAGVILIGLGGVAVLYALLTQLRF